MKSFLNGSLIILVAIWLVWYGKISNLDVTINSDLSKNKINKKSNTLVAAANLDNEPQNEVKGPGLTKRTYDTSEVGAVLSQFNTGKAISAVTMHNGYLFVPLSADHGGGNGRGAFAFYDVSDETNPQPVFDSRDHRSVYHGHYDDANFVGDWAEQHAIPVIGNMMVISEKGGRHGGIAIFDTSNLYDDDPDTLPEVISRFQFPGVNRPTNYDGFSFALAVKGGRYVFAPTGSYGLYIIDIIDPKNPRLVKRIKRSELSGINYRSANIIGDILLLTDSSFSTVSKSMLVMDITDPENPLQLSIKNDFALGYQGFMYGAEYFSTRGNAIRSYDITDPSNIITKVYNQDTKGQFNRPEYGFGKDNFIFIGHYPGLTKWDLDNPTESIANIEPRNPRADDYAFITPLGNTAIVTSDHSTPNKLNFGVHATEPDNLPPSVKYILPENRATNISVNASVGISFTDYIDALSVNHNTIQVVNNETNEVVIGTYSQMFGYVNFMPNEPLSPDTTYEVVLTAGGVKDWSGNSSSSDIIATTFSTGENIDNVETPTFLINGGINEVLVNEETDFEINLNGESIDEFEFQFEYGDGTDSGPFSKDLNYQHTYTTVGNYVVTLNVKFLNLNKTVLVTDEIEVINPLSAKPSINSSKIVYDDSNQLVWNVNPDNNSVSAINTSTNSLAFEIPVGEQPYSLAVSTNAEIWVVNKKSGTISIVDATNGAVLDTISLDYASAPSGIVIDIGNRVAYVSLEATKEVIKIDVSSRNIVGSLKVSNWPRNMAFDASREKLWVAHFISPDDAGKLTVINTTDFSLSKEVDILPSTDEQETEISGRGLPNYLGAMTISPDGNQLFVPSKKDNIYRGGFVDGNPLTFETTVRSMGVTIDLSSDTEIRTNRIDFNNSDFVTAAVYSNNGNMLYTSTNGTNTIWIVDPHNVEDRTQINSGGLAPDGMAVSSDGEKLFIHNFMSRDVTIINTKTLEQLAIVNTVRNEKLSDQVLLGKKIFYDSNDTRLAQDGYMSCATCHLDGGHDGRTWDFTNLGEGLRNTIDLKGKGRKGHGQLHWTSNFDEPQDFENQIRDFSLGKGLMLDKYFNTTSATLGKSKKDLSVDLDALAAYINSLESVDESPYTDSGDLTSSAKNGKRLYYEKNCVACHGGTDFTDSPTKKTHDIGTIIASSGKRLNEALNGLDTPTLKGLWYTAPYLHDGSAATIEEAIEAHRITDSPEITESEMTQLVSYMKQISNNECLVTSGAACDDGNPLTINDMYTEDCICIGEALTTCNADGVVLLNHWENVSGERLPNLETMADYPFNPNNSSELSDVIEVVGGSTDRYLQEVTGLLCVPQTGEYTFWVSGDNAVELYLSTDEKSTNQNRIASLSTYTEQREWDKFDTQESQKITLEVGKQYYFRVIHKEDTGGDHFSVGWQLPDGTLERPMTASHFSLVPANISCEDALLTTNVYKNNELEAGTKLYTVTNEDSLRIEPQSSSKSEENWIWFGPDNFTATTREISLSGLSVSGEYEVYHTTEEGCFMTDKFYVRTDNDLIDSDSINDVLIYPNPVVNEFHLSSRLNLDEANIQLFDVYGRKAFTSKINIDLDAKKVNISALSSGVYQVKIKIGKKVIVKKIIKK